MKPHADLTPYPILLVSGNDYVGASFHSDVSIKAISDKYVVKCAFDLDEPTLQKLIEEGLAEYIIHIECPRTSFRRIVRFNDLYGETTISSNAVSGFLEICTYIVCTSFIKGFSTPRFHPDYQGITFDLETGSILGIGESYKIELDDEDSDESTPSIVRISRAPSGQVDDMTVQTDGDFIYIELSSDLYDKYYRTSRGFLGEAVSASIVLPALMLALIRFKEVEDNDYLWVRVLDDWCHANEINPNDIEIAGIEGQSVLSIAQRMLQNPLGRALASMEEVDPLNGD